MRCWVTIGYGSSMHCSFSASEIECFQSADFKTRVRLLYTSIRDATTERLGEAVIAALKGIRAVPVAVTRVTLFQDGESPGTLDETGETYARIIGFRVSISG